MKYFYLAALAAFCWACGSNDAQPENNKDATETVVENPSAEGFNLEGSDQTAIKWADAVMRAQGGRAAWDSARYFHWTFFGRRSLLWDKKTGRVRIEIPEDSTVYLINILDNTGRVYTEGSEVKNQVRLPELIQDGKSIWNNDSYWLFMPFKLKDPGVTLYYAGMVNDDADPEKKAAVVEMHFDNVGDTPQNKYRIYIDPRDSLVHAWAYYNERGDEKPTFIMPWKDYQQYGNLKLSGDRGERKITDIWVKKQISDNYFTKFWPTKIELQNTAP